MVLDILGYCPANCGGNSRYIYIAAVVHFLLNE
jgi:hypothetical protein